jgi:hypothetical protein
MRRALEFNIVRINIMSELIIAREHDDTSHADCQ